MADGFERLGMIQGEISQNLAVEFDAAFIQLAHEHRIRHSILTSTRVNPLNPQRAELALFVAAVAIGVRKALFDRVFGNRPNVFATSERTFGEFEDLFASCAARYRIV